MDRSFEKQNIAYALLDILNEYYDVMDEVNQQTLKGVSEAIDTLDEDHENFEVDITNYLNTIIDLCTGFENQMSQADKEDFEDSMTAIANMDAIDKLNEGEMVIYDGLPYMIWEIDYDDTTVCIGRDALDNGMWVDPIDLKLKC